MKNLWWIIAVTAITIVGCTIVFLNSFDNERKMTVAETSDGKSDLDGAAADSSLQDPEESPEKQLITGRVFPIGEIDVQAVRRSRQQFLEAKVLRSGSSLPLANWIQRGPFRIQGRVTDIVVDPRDDDVVYVAAAEGGIFKTIDGGNSWVPVFDDIPTMSMGALALDPANPDVVFAGTGEANPSADSFPGSGLYKSVDGGNTWSLLGLEDSGRIGRIVIHPTDSNIMHVAVGGYVWSTGPDRGVYRTTDGGASWTKVLYVDESTGAIDIVQRPDNPDVLFAAMWERYRSPGDRVTGGLGSGVFKSTDGGVNWIRIENGLPVQSPDVGRIGLSISQTNPDVMVYVYTLTSGSFGGVFRTVDGGDAWTQVNDGDISDIHSSFGWWFGNIRIDPFDENTFWVLGLYKVRSTNGGNSFETTSDGMHVDHHAMAFGADDGSKIYAGNDGGVYYSTDGGASFQKTTGDLPITAAYRIATADWDNDALWIGTQDNGSSEDLDGDGTFNFIFGGDGFEVVPYLNGASKLWAQYQWGNVFYRDAIGDWYDARDGLTGRRNWNAPHAQDPSDADTRYYGSNFVFRNNGDTSWTQISDDLTDGDQSISTRFGTLTTIGVSPANSDVIWAGADDGNVHVTDDGGVTWTKVSDSLPTRWITSVRPHPTDANECLVSLSGFQWGEDMAHVYRTTDLGQNWETAGSGLPDMPVNDVMYDPMNTDRYFAATDIGVYQTFDNGASWELFGQGMPAASVHDFAFRTITRELAAGTHGRSIFTITLPEIYAASITVNDGVLVSGNASALASSDDEYLSVRRDNPAESIVQVSIKGQSAIANPAAMNIVLEASVFGGSATTQTLSLMNYASGEFEEVDSRPASRSKDLSIELAVSGKVSRFVEPGTGCVEAQLTFTGRADRIQFTANVDQLYWHVIE